MKAIVLGATGLIGKELIQQLIRDDNYEKIYLLSRKSLDFEQDKIENYVVDFELLSKFPFEDKIDTIFVAFGTTLAIAGSKKNQFHIDVDIPTKVMKLAKECGVKSCCLVSAMGVSQKSPFFYSRMKAALDENSKGLNFDQLILLKPSMLEGNRLETRRGEQFGILIFNLLGKTGIFENYRPVKIKKVANCMRKAILIKPNGLSEILSKEIQMYS
jgi:uncharacterized protein YbjT (DUF2867 family)